jgi:hypothetical protein
MYDPTQLATMYKTRPALELSPHDHTLLFMLPWAALWSLVRFTRLCSIDDSVFGILYSWFWLRPNASA